MRRLPILVIAFAVAATGCSGSSDSADTVTVYSGRAEELVGPLIEQFEAQSRIDVSVRFGDSAELAATLLEEGRRSPASVFLAQDPASLGSVALAGLFCRTATLFPHMTVARNVAYGLNDRDRSGRVGEVLDLVGLSEFDDQMPNELSGGEQQRIALARALAPGPEIVLLDEPFSNLDAPQRDRIRREVRRILTDAAATAPFVTHDQEQALAIADTVPVMRDGAVVQIGTPSDVYTRPVDPRTSSFLGDSVFLEGTVGSGGTVATSLRTLSLSASESGPVRVKIRPEWIIPTTDPVGESVVVGREYFGHDQMLLIERADGSTVTCRVGARPHLRTGDRVSLSIDEAVVYPVG